MSNKRTVTIFFGDKPPITIEGVEWLRIEGADSGKGAIEARFDGIDLGAVAVRSADINEGLTVLPCASTVIKLVAERRR